MEALSKMDFPTLLGFSELGILAVVALIATGIYTKGKSFGTKLIFLWYFWDLGVHVLVEGAFLYFQFNGLVDKSDHPLAGPWKIYATTDYRWGKFFDSTVISVETLTVFGVSPLCLAMLYATVKNPWWKHYIQLVLCTAELYGGWMTFAPEWFTGNQNLNASDPFLFWFYLVIPNAIWVVIPLILMIQSWNELKHVHQVYNANKPKPKHA